MSRRIDVHVRFEEEDHAQLKTEAEAADLKVPKLVSHVMRQWLRLRGRKGSFKPLIPRTLKKGRGD